MKKRNVKPTFEDYVDVVEVIEEGPDPDQLDCAEVIEERPASNPSSFIDRAVENGFLEVIPKECLKQKYLKLILPNDPVVLFPTSKFWDVWHSGDAAKNELRFLGFQPSPVGKLLGLSEKWVVLYES